MKIIVLLAVLVFGVYIGTSINENNTKAVKVQMVQMVCDIAHNENSGESEQACGDVQDQTNTEYICSHSGTSCWVEEL